MIDDEKPSDADSRRDLPAGWVPLGEQHWYDGWLALWGLIGFLVLIDVVQGVFWLGRLIGLAPALAISGASALVVIVAGTVLFNRRGGQVSADFSTGRLRVGPRTIAFSDLTSASIFAGSATGAILFRLESPAVRASITLRDRRGRILDEQTRHLVAEVVERSSIAYPASPYDPTGRFAEYNFPEHFDKARAVNLMRNPALPGSPMPEQR